MNNKQKETLEVLRRDPTPADLKWDDVESLFKALGAEVSQGNGSRIRVVLNGVRAVFHQPHPSKEVKKSSVRAIRTFLENANIP
jgi:HicA toxin of bacterial toxin-antitoxin,